MKRVVLVTVVSGASVLFAVVFRQNQTVFSQTTGASSSNNDVRRFARLVVSYELAHIHATGLEGEPKMKAYWSHLYEQMLAEIQVDASWTARIIDSKRPPVARPLADANEGKRGDRDAQLTAFETRAVKRIDDGVEEVLERPSRFELRYARRIKPLESCTTCHSAAMKVPPIPGVKFVSSEIKGTIISVRITLAK